MHTKRLGNIGELKALATFAQYEIPVFIPYGEAERVDFIADFNNKLNRIQVKSTANIIDGVLKFGLRSTAVNTTTAKANIYTSEEIDYFVLYCLENDELYIISIDEAPATQIMLRTVPPNSNQIAGVRYAKDYSLHQFLKNLQQEE